MTLSDLPPSTVSLAWALMALRLSEGIGGITYAGISQMLGVVTQDGLRALTRRAEDAGVVTTRYQKGRPVVSLSAEALRTLEGVLKDG